MQYNIENPVVNIKNLNFAYEKGGKNIVNLNCKIPKNAKVILLNKPKAKTISSGNNEIEGNIDNRVSFQLDVNL